MDDLPVFRVSKRRKFTRQRHTPAEDDIQDNQIGSDQKEDETADTDDANVSELLKLRKQSRQRGTGVQFSQQRRADHDEIAESMAMVVADPAEEKLRDMSNRFVGSTGQVVDVDKHMMAYIDSQMAKSRHTATTQEASDEYTDSESDVDDDDDDDDDNDNNAVAPLRTTQPLKTTAQHPFRPQLAEVDLGPGAHATNLARTSAALARAQSGLPPATEEDERKKSTMTRSSRRPRKPRLGRDGKPQRVRPPRRGRRTSEDVARDALVEQVLREHKVEGYEGDGSGGGGARQSADDGGDRGDADERLAEQFRQEFMDAMADRRQRGRIKAAAAAKAKGVSTESHGPKLGGSRSARAKMAQLQKQQKSSAGQK